MIQDGVAMFWEKVSPLIARLEACQGRRLTAGNKDALALEYERAGVHVEGAY